jgi:hypothetical protein
LGLATTTILQNGALWPVAPPFISGALAMAAMLVSVGFSAGTIVCVRRARYAQLLLPAPRRRAPRREAPGLAAAFLGDLGASPHGTLVALYYLGLTTLLGVLIGASSLLPIPESHAATPSELLRVVVGLVVLLSSCVLALSLERIGPTAKIFYARFALENGQSVKRVTWSLFGLYAGLAVPIGAVVALGSWIVTGKLFLSALGVALIVAAAEAAAECLVAPLPNTDGSRSLDVASSILAYALMTPCLLVLFLDPVLSELFISAYAVVLAPGALACLRHRLTRLS